MKRTQKETKMEKDPHQQGSIIEWKDLPTKSPCSVPPVACANKTLPGGKCVSNSNIRMLQRIYPTTVDTILQGRNEKGQQQRRYVVSPLCLGGEDVRVAQDRYNYARHLVDVNKESWPQATKRAAVATTEELRAIIPSQKNGEALIEWPPGTKNSYLVPSPPGTLAGTYWGRRLAGNVVGVGRYAGHRARQGAALASTFGKNLFMGFLIDYIYGVLFSVAGSLAGFARIPPPSPMGPLLTLTDFYTDIAKALGTTARGVASLIWRVAYMQILSTMVRLMITFAPDKHTFLGQTPPGYLARMLNSVMSSEHLSVPPGASAWLSWNLEKFTREAYKALWQTKMTPELEKAYRNAQKKWHPDISKYHHKAVSYTLSQAQTAKDFIPSELADFLKLASERKAGDPEVIKMAERLEPLLSSTTGQSLFHPDPTELVNPPQVWWSAAEKAISLFDRFINSSLDLRSSLRAVVPQLASLLFTLASAVLASYFPAYAMTSLIFSTISRWMYEVPELWRKTLAQTAEVGEIEKAALAGDSLSTIAKKADLELMRELQDIDRYSGSPEETRKATELAYKSAIRKIEAIHNGRQKAWAQYQKAAAEGASARLQNDKKKRISGSRFRSSKDSRASPRRRVESKLQPSPSLQLPMRRRHRRSDVPRVKKSQLHFSA